MSGKWLLVGAAVGAGIVAFIMKDELADKLRCVHLSYDDERTQHKEVTVNKDEVMGKWHEIKGKVKEKWGDLTDDELTQGEGKLEELAGTIQKKYGGLKEEILAYLRAL